MRIVVSIVLSLVLSSCLRLAHLQKTPPIRTMAFSGSYEKVARCVQTRVGGKVYADPSDKKISVYDAVNFLEPWGVSHYALIFFQRRLDGSWVAEFRKRPVGPIDDSMIIKFWSPVEDCIKQLADRKSTV